LLLQIFPFGIAKPPAVCLPEARLLFIKFLIFFQLKKLFLQEGKIISGQSLPDSRKETLSFPGNLVGSPDFFQKRGSLGQYPVVGDEADEGADFLSL